MKNKNLKKKLSAGALAAGVITLTTLRAGAAPIGPINVVNPGFEENSGIPPTGWSSGAAQSNNNYLSTHVGNGASGNNYLGVLPQYGLTPVGQTTTADITAANTGDTITLKVAIGEFAAGGYTYGVTSADYYGDVELLIGGTVVATNNASDTPALIAGGFTEMTMTYTVESTDSGDVSVEFVTPVYNSNLSNQLQDRDYDNVSLDLSAPSVPEPSTWAMLLAGVLSLVGLRASRTSRVKRAVELG